MSIASDLEKVRRLHLDQPQAKILTIDIESSPNLAHVWGLWKQNIPINMIETPGEVMCFAAKWYGHPDVLFYSTYHDGKDAMINAAWDLLNEADIVVHYNGKRYDVPHLNREFWLCGLTPPSPFVQIDLLGEVKRNFNFPSNKLDYIVQQLNIGAKTPHAGFQMWWDCMYGDDDAKAKAWTNFREYNINDTVIEEELYDRIMPWIKSHPVVFNIIEDTDLICVKDGSDNLVKTGKTRIGMFEYDKYMCGDCGSWYRNREATRVTSLRGI